MIPGCPMTVMIPKSECKDRQLYRLHARNIAFGVYRAEDGAFFGLRTKFGTTFVEPEFHWNNDDDNGEYFGSAKPVEELPEVLPTDIVNDDDLGTACSVCGKDTKYVKWPEGDSREHRLWNGKTMLVEGRWQHTDGTRCDGMAGNRRSNKPLYDWLVTMNAKYGKSGGEGGDNR